MNYYFWCMKITASIKNKYPCFNKSLKNLKGEEWREIPHTEGYYVISNYGRVKALARYIENQTQAGGRWIKEKILSQQCSKNKNRYKNDYTFGTVVRYTFNKQKFNAMTRRLVYEAFIQPQTKENMKGKFVYSKDGDRFNSNSFNLALATKSDLRKMDLEKDRYIPPAFKVDPEKNRRHLLKLNRKKRRIVKQYRFDGKLLNEFPSITVASRKTSISISCISACATGISPQASGFVWRFEEDSYNGELRFWKGNTKEIVQYSIPGKKIKTFNAIIEAERQSKIDARSIIRCAKKITRQAGGFVWRYIGDTYNGEYEKLYQPKRIVQYNLQGNKLAGFESISVAAQKTGSSYEGIRLTLKQKSKTCNGFIWQYEKK